MIYIHEARHCHKDGTVTVRRWCSTEKTEEGWRYEVLLPYLGHTVTRLEGEVNGECGEKKEQPPQRMN